MPKEEKSIWSSESYERARVRGLRYAKTGTRLVLVLVALGLVVVSIAQVIQLWPSEPDLLRQTDETRTFYIEPGESHTFVDPRQQGEHEPRRHVEIHTHFESIDFANEEVTFTLSAVIDRDWIDIASRDHPEALLWFQLYRIIPASLERRKTAAEFLQDTDEDEDFELPWVIGTFTEKFETDAAAFPLDQVFAFGQYSMIWMRSKNQAFPRESAPVYLDWTYSVAARNVGWVLEVASTPGARHDYRQRADFVFKRDNTTITHAAIYLIALLCVSLAVAFFSITRARQPGSHIEEIGGIVALALAIPAIRSLLPGPGVGILTLMDAGFLLLFSIVIAAILLRIALQIRPGSKALTQIWLKEPDPRCRLHNNCGGRWWPRY